MARKVQRLFQTVDELENYYFPKLAKADKEIMKHGTKQPIVLRAKRTRHALSLYLDYYQDGRRKYEFLGLYLNVEKDSRIKEQNRQTMEAATVIADTKNTDVIKGGAGIVTTRKGKTNLLAYIQFQAEAALKRTGNRHSIYAVLQALSKHIRKYSGDNTRLMDVDKDYITGFVEYLKTANNLNYKRTGTDRDKEKPVSQNTQHNLFIRLKFIIKEAVKQDILESNPFEKLEQKEEPRAEDGTREFLTVEEIKKLIKTPCRNDTLKRAFLFCCLVGLRYSDVSSITWGELEKDNAGDTLLRFKMKKVKRAASLYLSDEALKWLPERGEAKADDRIFPLGKNDYANKQLAAWVKSAGITKRITFHCSRHTAATLSLSLGISVETVSRMLGHTKIQTTQIYAKVLNSSLKEAANKQNGIFE